MKRNVINVMEIIINISGLGTGVLRGVRNAY
jgi:hypothetical protein